uniref:Uncharacterized protein n=1 Tax=viral metagenome TaxID=1070528 RepID=A0A6C0DI34_9ZZZZ
MPYIPPHLRPGYVATVIKKPDFKGKVHWPTNVNKNSNIVEELKIHSPHLGIMGAKSALKITKPIRLNNQPIVKPSMHLGKSKFNNAVRRHIYKEMGSRRHSRRRSATLSKKKVSKTRRRRTH